MKLGTVFSVVAIGMFAAYFAPIALKLGDAALTVVVLGGIAFAALDAFGALKAKGPGDTPAGPAPGPDREG